MLVKLRYDEPLSNVAFKFSLRRYTTLALDSAVVLFDSPYKCWYSDRQGVTLLHFSPQPEPFWSASRFDVQFVNES